MKINVGSKNPTKVQSVILALQDYPMFKDAEVFGVDVKSEEFGQPIGILSVIQGSKKRAKLAFENCDYSFGIEGGLIQVPETKSGYMQVDVCAIYDGDNFHLGFGPSFEWPKSVTDLIINNGRDASQALREAGFTDDEKIGAAGGGISIFTKGRMDRIKFNRIAVAMALIHLENKNDYENKLC